MEYKTSQRGRKLPVLNLKSDTGIYRIWSPLEAGSYIGSSSKLQSRIWGHFRDMQKQKHNNRGLQNIYDCYGLENIEVEILEYLDTSAYSQDLLDAEEKWTVFYADKEPSFGQRCGSKWAYDDMAEARHTAYWADRAALEKKLRYHQRKVETINQTLERLGKT